MASPILDLTQSPLSSYVLVKTNIGGWFFDAFLTVSPTSTLTITEHPIQAGSTVSDYAFLQPRTLDMSIGMSDTATSFLGGQFSGGSSRSVQAYQVLSDLQQQRIPVQVYTRLGLYQNMLVQNLTAQDDYTTVHGLRASVTLQELLVATVTVVKISANPAVTSKAKTAKKQPLQVPPSILAVLGLAIN
jgi:hypothetical protein